jgi:hypothetical protein
MSDINVTVNSPQTIAVTVTKGSDVVFQVGGVMENIEVKQETVAVTFQNPAQVQVDFPAQQGPAGPP